MLAKLFGTLLVLMVVTLYLGMVTIDKPKLNDLIGGVLYVEFAIIIAIMLSVIWFA